MDAGAKDALMVRLGTYLEGLDQIPPQPEAGAPDLFTLLVELTALKNEVKIESRQVKAALDIFRETFDTLRQAYDRLEGEQARQGVREAREHQEAERDLLVELLELRDRLQAGHSQLSRYRPGWLARRGGAATYVADIATGQGMLLRRLDEILARRDLHPLPALGQRFDPMTMHAIQTAQDAKQPDGLVLTETRTGFLYRGRLLRPAEVIVNKIALASPSGKNPGEDPNRDEDPSDHSIA
jgi:molecular chaperone GrpE